MGVKKVERDLDLTGFRFCGEDRCKVVLPPGWSGSFLELRWSKESEAWPASAWPSNASFGQSCKIILDMQRTLDITLGNRDPETLDSLLRVTRHMPGEDLVYIQDGFEILAS